MPFTLDSELAAVMAEVAAAADGPPPVAPRGDALALRAIVDGLLGAFAASDPATPDVTAQDHQIDVAGGESILARWYTRSGSDPGSAIVYYHGGGLVAGTVDNYDGLVRKYVHDTGVPFLSVEYRLAPEVTGPTLVEDAHTALVWLVERAGELGIAPDRIAVMGDSGGGCIAAGVAIAARDAGTPLAKQILIYPMLDDRNIEPDPEIAPFALWTYDQNFTGWQAALGDELGADGVSPLSAPARLEDFSGLAPAFIDVGELDIFRDEDLLYALRLVRAGVPTEFHLRPGCIHGFDRAAPNIRVSEASYADRYRAITTV